MGLLRYGSNGEPGVDFALGALCARFIETVGPDREGGADEAAAEFDRFITGAGHLLDDDPGGEDAPIRWPSPRPHGGSPRGSWSTTLRWVLRWCSGHSSGSAGTGRPTARWRTPRSGATSTGCWRTPAMTTPRASRWPGTPTGASSTTPWTP